MGVTVPMVDLSWQYEQCKEQIDEAVLRVMRSGKYILGDAVAQFERKVANYLGVQHAVGVANGTDALVLALRASGVRRGDSVAVPAMTYIATAHAVVRAGAKVTPVEVDESGAMCVDELRRWQVQAIIPVHLYGHMADMDAINDVAAEIGAVVIEDAAQAMSASLDGVMAGTWADAGCFSFFPTKPLGAAGDGGLVVTDSDMLAERVRVSRAQGSLNKRDAAQVGLNSRLDALQAAVLSVKLGKLEQWRDLRDEAASFYDLALQEVERVQPVAVVRGRSAHHLYVVKLGMQMDREVVRKRMRVDGVATQVHYPDAIHRHRVYGEAARAKCPRAEELAERCLSLPLYPGISPEQQDQVVKSLKAAVCEVG